ncbi:hypothetical protein [Lysobacter sp. M15]|uniref:hypothetical protein n=1 Tax=Lysobacter sp. M15 TaxID=2916837 RepID=UPI001F5AD5F2|nr:hypothetical protein [Lysobacter sp. M15]
MRLLATILVAAALALPGCASIPLSTAIRLSSLKPRALTQIDPGEVRVRVSVPAGFHLNMDASRLTLSLKAPNGRSQRHEMTLSLLQTARETRSAGLFSRDMAVSTYTLALSPSGASRLRSAQQFVLAENPDNFEFGVYAPLAKMPAGAREITFWADLRLSSKEQYMPLIDGAKFMFDARAAGG